MESRSWGTSLGIGSYHSEQTYLLSSARLLRSPEAGVPAVALVPIHSKETYLLSSARLLRSPEAGVPAWALVLIIVNTLTCYLVPDC